MGIALTDNAVIAVG